MQIFRLSDLQRVSVIEGVDCLQPVLSAEPPRRFNTRETLTEAIVADLGDRSSISPYLIVRILALHFFNWALTHGIQLRTNNDDLIVYKPIFTPPDAGNGSSYMRFIREANRVLPRTPLEPAFAQDEMTQRFRPLRILPDISGLSAVFMPGESAGFVFRTATSLPHMVRFRGEYTRWLSSFDSAAAGCGKGFIYVDSKVSGFPFVQDDAR